MDYDISQLIAHRWPMVFIERLVKADGESAEAVQTFAADGYGTADGRVLETTLVETMAQAAAAMHGLSARRAGTATPPAFLVGLSDVRFLAPVCCGQELRIKIQVERVLASFRWVRAVIESGGQVVAQGELKFHIGIDSSDGSAGDVR